MESTSRTIENYRTQSSNQETRQQQNTMTTTNWPLELNTFATLFALNLVHRFPNWQTIDQIDSNSISKIARLCAVAASIGLEEYCEVNDTLFRTEQMGSQNLKKVS